MKPITFSTHILLGKRPSVQVIGKAFEHCGIPLAVHRELMQHEPYQPDPKGRYEVSEPSTGYNICRYAKTQKEAVANAIARIDSVGVERTKEIIKKFLKERP